MADLDRRTETDGVVIQQLISKMDAVGQAVDGLEKRLLDKIDFTDKSSQQLVELVKERLLNVQKRAEEIAQRQEIDRIAFSKQLQDLDTKIDKHHTVVNKKIEDQVAAVNKRVGSLEISRAKLIGLVFGSSITGGGVVAVIARALGGA